LANAIATVVKHLWLAKGRSDVRLERLGNGERIAVISAVFLFAFMFLHWFGVKAVNASNLLFAIQAVGPGKDAWEALDWIPTVLLITSLATLAAATLRVAGAFRRGFAAVNMVGATLGFASVLLIFFRIVNPPVFYVERTVTFEGAIRFPMFLALVAAAGVGFGCLLALREEAGQRATGDSAPTQQALGEGD